MKHRKITLTIISLLLLVSLFILPSCTSKATTPAVTANPFDVLQTRVTNLDSRIASLESKISSLGTTDTTALRTSISSIQADVSTIKSDQATIKTSITSLQTQFATLNTSLTAVDTRLKVIENSGDGTGDTPNIDAQIISLSPSSIKEDGSYTIKVAVSNTTTTVVNNLSLELTLSPSTSAGPVYVNQTGTDLTTSSKTTGLVYLGWDMASTTSGLAILTYDANKASAGESGAVGARVTKPCKRLTFSSDTFNLKAGASGTFTLSLDLQYYFTAPDGATELVCKWTPSIDLIQE